MGACRPRPASRPHPMAFGAPDQMSFIEQHLFNAGSRKPAPAEPQRCTDLLASLEQSLMNLGLIPEAVVAESHDNGASNPPPTPSHDVTPTDFRQALTRDILASLVNRIRQEGREASVKGNKNKQDEVEKRIEGSKDAPTTKEEDPLKWHHIIDCGKFGTERVLVKVDDGKVIVRASREESSPHGFVSSTKMEQTIQLPCNIERENIICRILSNSKLLIEAPIIPRKSIDNNLSKQSPTSADDDKEEERNQTNKLKGDSDSETEMKSETSRSEPIIDDCCSDTTSECTKSEASRCDSFVVIEDGQEIETEGAIEDNNAEIIEKEEDQVEEKTGHQEKAHPDASEGDKTEQALTYKERERTTTTAEAGVTAEYQKDTEEEFEQITGEETTNKFEAVQGNSNTIQNVDVLSKINDAMLEETNKQESQDDETHITEDDSDFKVRLELPSVDPSSIKVTMDDFRRLLVVQAALPAGQGHVSRVVPVPGHVEAAALRCQMQDGALTLRAPRATVRDIPVVM